MNRKNIFSLAWLLLALTAPLAAQSAAVSQPPQLSWQGSWKPGALLVAVPPAGYQLYWQGKLLPVDRDGRVLLGLQRDAQGEVALDIERRETGQRWPLLYPLQHRDYVIQRVEGVPQQTVTPPPEQLQRIRREAALVAAARSSMLDQPLYASGFQPPAEGPISGVYGSQRFYNGEPGRPHYGVDYAAPLGAAVTAPAAGRVVLAEADLFYSGGTVIVDHGFQLYSSFLHMSEVSVAVGDNLEPGDKIGEVGASGRATGPHLDWRMNWGQTRIDPLLVLQALPKAAHSD